MKPGMSLMKHYLQFKDLRAEEYAYLFERTAIIKTRFKNYEKYQPLVDRTLAMIFEKASTRTRVSFEAGMYQMGGSVVHLTTGDSQLGRAEPVEDSARVISRMVDIVMIRTYEQSQARGLRRALARAGDQRPDQRIPPLPDPGRHLHLHRAARLASRARSVAWVGDGNNMANTWLQAADILGFTLHVSTPSGYEIDAEDGRREQPRLREDLQQPVQRLRRRAPGDHRRLDQHGLRGRERGAPEGLRRLVRGPPR